MAHGGGSPEAGTALPYDGHPDVLSAVETRSFLHVLLNGVVR